MNQSPHFPGKKSRSAAALLFAACAAGSPLHSRAATVVWDGGAGADSAYLADTNWNPDLGTGTGPGTGDVAQFDLAGSASTIGIDFGAATNNGPANEGVGQILLNNGISRTITNSSTTTAGSLKLFGGPGGIALLNSSASSTLTIQDGANQPMAIVLAIPLGFEATNPGASIIINSVIGDGGSGLGSGTLGLGTVVLNANNTFTGDFSINGGVTSVPFLTNTGIAQPLGRGTGQLGLGNILNNGTLLYTGSATTTNRNIALGSAGGTVSNINPLTFTGVISNAGSFTKAGVGILTVSQNTYTGRTIINGGTLSVAADNRLGAVPTTVQTSNITINAGTLSGSTGFSTAINRGILLGSSQSAIDVQAGVVTFTGIISGSGALNKTGPGALDLRVSSNTYTGGTLIKGGRLDITQDRNLGAIPTAPQADNVILDGGTLRFYSILAAGLTLDANRGVSLTANGGTIDFAQTQSSPTIGYPISSPAGSVLTRLGNRTVLSNIAQPNMNGDLNLSGGRWNVQINGAAGNGTIRLAALNGDFAQLGIGGTNAGLTITVSQPIVLNPTGNGINSFEVNNSTPTQNELRLTGNITGTGGLLKGAVSGTTGILTLSGNNSYGGATTVNLGTLRVGSGNAIPDASLVTLTSTNSSTIALDVTANETIGGLSGGAATTAGISLTNSSALTVIQSTPSTYAGTISGVGGSFVKDGSDTLILTNANNSYSGSTTIKAGTLSVPGSGQLGSAANSLVFDGGTLMAAGAINSPARDITLSAGGGTIDTNGNAVTVGNIDGTGNFTRSGGSTLTTNHIRGGNVVLNAGTTAIVPNGNAAGVSHIKTLTVNGLLDLTDNHLITTSTAGTWNGSAYTDVTGLVTSARGSSNLWDGTTGITTTQTQAVSSNYTSLGVAKASDVRPNTASETALWAGQMITGTDTLVMYTYGGDATLDGKINIDDYVRIDSGISAVLTGWSNGDFNYDGKVSIDDYITVIDANIDNQSGIFFTTGGIPEGVSAVPEPASVSLLLAPIVLALNRRRRKH